MSTLSPSRFRRVSIALCAALVATCALIAAVGVPQAAIPTPTPGERLLIGVGLCGGPLSGWVSALVRGSASSAWPLLSTATVICLLPFSFAIRRRSDVALALSAMLWLGAGYLFTIAIWI